MFETIAIFYTQIFGVVLPATAIAILMLGTQRANLSMRQTTVALGGLIGLIGVWHAVVVSLGQAGVWLPPVNPTDVPYALMPLIGGTIILWVLGRLTTLGRRIVDSLTPRELISIQVFRLMGGVFVLGWFMGAIPWQFALTAGVGDVLAGLAAIRAVRALDRGDANAEQLVWRANVIGLADFVVAVSIGIMTSPGFMQVMAFDNPNIINAYPLALFPEFIVPIFAAFQLFSLGAIYRRRAAAEAPA
mgnify:CR=1 FL=1